MCNEDTDACDLTVEMPRPEDNLGITCTDDGECDYDAKCVNGVCYAPKHRYVSIALNPDQVENTARRVSLSGGGAGPWWIDAPYSTGGLDLAELTDTPLPDGAGWHAEGFTGAVLPYDNLTKSDNPAEMLLDFLRTVQRAGAALMR